MSGRIGKLKNADNCQHFIKYNKTQVAITAGHTTESDINKDLIEEDLREMEKEKRVYFIPNN